MLVAPSRWKIKAITSQKARGTCLCLFMGSAQRELAGGTGQKVVSFLCNNLWQPAAPELARCEMTCLQHLWVGRLRDTCWEMVELEFAGEGNIQACLPTAAGCLEVSLQESGVGGLILGTGGQTLRRKGAQGSACFQLMRWWLLSTLQAWQKCVGLINISVHTVHCLFKSFSPFT